MSACSEGAVTLTMKTSRMTMKTGANSTGRSQGLRLRVDPGISAVSVICGFNGWPPVAVSSFPELWLAFRRGVCEHFDPGTREGFILESKDPAKPAEKPANGNNSAALDAGDGVPRRAELADFLRTRREAIRPEHVGLRAGGRRRTPGLRREEVAQLAGVGTT